MSQNRTYCSGWEIFYILIIFRRLQRRIFRTNCICLIIVCGLMWKGKDAKNVSSWSLFPSFREVSTKEFGIKRNLLLKGGQLLPISTWFGSFHVLPLIMICYPKLIKCCFSKNCTAARIRCCVILQPLLRFKEKNKFYVLCCWCLTHI